MDNYHFYEEIAKGKHAVVFKARKKNTIDYFSVKSIDKCERKKLMNEVKLMHPLDHTNVLRFYNWYETKNHLWAIFEYASGGNLQALMEKDKILTEPQILMFAKELVQGLHYMHSKGVVYCDLKPSNVLLNEYGTLKFNDFGLAKSTVDLIQTEEDRKEGPKRGTLCYMAPELFQDDGLHSFQSDLWSLGCMLYEMGTGKSAFTGKSFNETVQQILNSSVEQIPGFSKEFHSLLFALLSKNPLHRPTWNDIISHAFFDWNPMQLKHLLSEQIPQQPHFDRWAIAKYPPAPLPQSLPNSSTLPNTKSSSNILSNHNKLPDNMNSSNHNNNNDGVNLLRLSMNAKNNQWREMRREEESYSGATATTATASNRGRGQQQQMQQQQDDGDFLIQNRNETIDIGGGGGSTSLAAISDRGDDYNEYIYQTIQSNVPSHQQVAAHGNQDEHLNTSNNSNNTSLGLLKHQSSLQSQQQQMLLQQQQQQTTSQGKIKSYGGGPTSTAGSLYYTNSANPTMVASGATVSPSSGIAKGSNTSIGGSTTYSQQQPATKAVSLQNRSRAHQDEGGRSRQNGSHTPSSPNSGHNNMSNTNLTAAASAGGAGNLIRTPSQKMQNIVSPNSIGRQANNISGAATGIMGTPSTTGANIQSNLYQFVNSNSALLKTPTTPQQQQLLSHQNHHAGLATTTTTTKSVSPYHHNTSQRGTVNPSQQQQYGVTSGLQNNHQLSGNPTRSASNNANVGSVYNGGGALKNSGASGQQLASPQSVGTLLHSSSSAATVAGSPYSSNANNASQYGQQSLANSRVQQQQYTQQQQQQQQQLQQSGLIQQQQGGGSVSQRGPNVIGISPNRKNSTPISNSAVTALASQHKNTLSSATGTTTTSNKLLSDLSPSSAAIAGQSAGLAYGNSSSSSSNNNNSGLSGNSNKIVLPFAHEPIEKLFLHASDTIAKPIIGHKDIEKTPSDMSFKKEAIPFAIYSAESVEKNLNSGEVQQLFESIFATLRAPQSSGNAEKLYHLLVYFESIIQNSTVANFLINSAFINLLLELLTNVRVPLVRMRVASCIGFLLRFATSIESDLSKLQLPLIIAEVFASEKDPKVGRKLMATLGEYLFYAATLVDDDPQNSVWRISPAIISFLVKKIGSYEEDELVRFYACKTLENITSQSITIGQQFCNMESIQSLVVLFLSTRNEDLKASAIVSLTHIGRLKNSFIDSIIAALGGVDKLCEILTRENAIHRTQQAVLTLINFALSMPASNNSNNNNTTSNANPTNALNTMNNSGNMNMNGIEQQQQSVQSRMRDPRFMQVIVSLLESSNTIIRGKAIICLYLCITLNPRCLVDICSTKFFTFIDKLARDNFKYVQQCFQHLRLVNMNCLPWLIQAVREDLIRVSKGEISSNIMHMYHQQLMNRNALPTLHGNLQFLRVLVSFAKCDQLKAMLFEETRLEECFNLFELLVNPAEGLLTEARSVLINLYEVILSNAASVLDRFEFFARRLLPKLIEHFQFHLQTSLAASKELYGSNNMSSTLVGMSEVMNANSNSQISNNTTAAAAAASFNNNDWKFTYLKVISDIIMILSQDNEKWSAATSSWLNEIFVSKVIGSILPMLVGNTASSSGSSSNSSNQQQSAADESLMLICLKLLQILVDTAPGLYVNALRNRGLFGLVASQFNATSTRSTLKLITRIVQASTLAEIQQYGITAKAITLFQHFVGRQQEQSYEDILDILLYISSKLMQVQPLQSIEKPAYFEYSIEQQYEVLVIAYYVCFSLLANGGTDYNLAEKASAFIVQILYLFAKPMRTSGTLCKGDPFAAYVNSLAVGFATPMHVKRNARVVLWISTLLSLPRDARDAMHAQLEKAAAISKDYKVSGLIRELAMKIKSSQYMQ